MSIRGFAADGEKRYRRKWIKRILTGLLALAWMFLIGSFSAQTGGESGNLSSQVADTLISVREWITGQEYSEAEREIWIQQMQFPVRKLAHMSEYALLVLLLVLHLGTYTRLTADRKQFYIRLALSFGIAVLYAATDEIHQLFVPGRSGQFTDVCFDGAGAALGVLFCLLCFLIRKRKIKKRRMNTG